MNTLLKNAREKKGLKTREVAQLLKIDQALISKFESGTRKPTKDQVIKLATLLEINLEKILIHWLKEKILHEIKDEKLALEALKLVEIELLKAVSVAPKSNTALLNILDKIANLQKQFKKLNPFDLRRITKQIELEFTFECTSINGNSMNFEETKLIINEGMTIGEKPMKEHLEVINFYEAVQYCKELVQRKNTFNEREFLQLHTILQREITTDQAGKYVSIETAKEIDVFFKWFEISKTSTLSTSLAAEAHLKLMSILPFKQYNLQMAILVMNLILLQNDFYFAIIRSDFTSKEVYITILQQSLTDQNSIAFTNYIAEQQRSTLSYTLSL